jgi:ubiquinone/menaquinone biosynthesis C-methylase UbiE
MTDKVDYDALAPAYDRRYEDHQFAGTEDALRAFVGAGQRVLEVGCGTGHWLAAMRALGCTVFGLDLSAQMLARAAQRGATGCVVRGRAESLPWADASFDRVVCINALHHVAGKQRFLHEARRVLRPGGGFLSIGLDPSAGRDRWFIYDYFEETRELDRGRYPAAAQVRSWLTEAGFASAATVIAEHIAIQRTAREALDGGWLTRAATSQLALLDDEQLARGIDRIRADMLAAEARGETLHLSVDVFLHATSATVA